MAAVVLLLVVLVHVRVLRAHELVHDGGLADLAAAQEHHAEALVHVGPGHVSGRSRLASHVYLGRGLPRARPAAVLRPARRGALVPGGGVAAAEGVSSVDDLVVGGQELPRHLHVSHRQAVVAASTCLE